MENYLSSAISKIYGEDDDFILLGLTGRTGSGCSTVAKILASPKENIRHSLFKGDCPADNSKRKEKIIVKHFEHSWQPFILIQVRSVITLMVAEQDKAKVNKFLSSPEYSLTPESIKNVASIIANIKDELELSLSNKSARVFYSVKLPSMCEQIKVILGESSFVKLYQNIGQNIRKSGNPLNQSQKQGLFFTLAERINTIIKVLLDQKLKDEKTFIVIDAIRSPLEAIFFQERYSSFYLMAISCEDEQRKQRLRDLGYTDPAIKGIDAQEYVDTDIEEESSFVTQDIQACLQRSDLYVSNPNADNAVSEFKVLTNQLLTFISLMKRPGIVTPTALERCMQMAYTAKLNSGCISRQVGAIITDANFSIQAVGWNDAPYGQVPCNLRNRFDLVEGKDQAAYSEYEKTESKFIEHFKEQNVRFIPIKDTGRNVSYCFKSEYNSMTGKSNQVHTRSLHAEENAFLQISKYGGRGIKDGNLFTTASPCELCAKKAYQLGIKNIYYIDPYPGIAMRHILMGGAHNPKMVIFFGAIGRAFHRLYTPIVAYKDELNALADT
ncbi:deoxycytidylate deaminase [Shewanella sp. ULN5]|uniref:deoxycytidylate deaminase n=1 Tax=Shewanella sp. ULN5 TaxID=2994678 RepID=UPI00273F5F4D|nr:deoxycytidylate deaminase [Shewanella sp. ULN5]MDP5145890.1 deoxycytidylate deaminase [Shewanella sp. ULN5]